MKTYQVRITSDKVNDYAWCEVEANNAAQAAEKYATLCKMVTEYIGPNPGLPTVDVRLMTMRSFECGKITRYEIDSSRQYHARALVTGGD